MTVQARVLNASFSCGQKLQADYAGDSGADLFMQTTRCLPEQRVALAQTEGIPADPRHFLGRQLAALTSCADDKPMEPAQCIHTAARSGPTKKSHAAQRSGTAARGGQSMAMDQTKQSEAREQPWLLVFGLAATLFVFADSLMSLRNTACSMVHRLALSAFSRSRVHYHHV